jgi:hypothetical protein
MRFAIKFESGTAASSGSQLKAPGSAGVIVTLL